MEKSVKLIENFVSWQGEGPDSGHSMIILRFKTCNLHCPWCDTSVKMRISAEAPYLLSDIQRQINETNAGLLITGGEPTVPRHFDDTVTLLNDLKYPIANVESNGFNLFKLITEVPPSKPVRYLYSPKIFSTADIDDALDKIELFEPFPEVFVKLVYEKNDFIETFLKELTENYSKMTWQHRIWLMPEGTTRADLIRNSEGVFNACEKYRVNFSSRSHIIFGFI